MSSSSNISYADLNKINFTGGFPTSKDLAPSIIFLVVYIALVPLLLWRVISPKHRGLILIRPAIFLVVRIAMLVLRAIMSKKSYGETELIVELVLVSIGYLFLMEPVIEMWRRHVATAVTADVAPRWVTLLSRLLKIALLVAIGTAIAGASKISGALDDPSELDTVKSLRKVSSIVAFGVSVVALFAIIATHFSFGLDARRTAYMIPFILALIVVALYRLIQTYSTNPDAAVRSAAAFWILQMLFELIAFVGILGISQPAWYPKPDDPKDVGQDVEMGRVSNSPVTVRK